MTSFDVCTVEGCNEDMARDLSLAEANAAHQRCIQNGAFCFLNALVLELGLEKVMDAVAEVERRGGGRSEVIRYLENGGLEH